MDHYISELNKNMEGCSVYDYAVYMKKQSGFARFNPFAAVEQLVIYLTDRGCYCCHVRGMGEFTIPVTLERAGLSVSDDGRQVLSLDNDDRYAFTRKWKEGVYAGCEEFGRACVKAV